MSYQVLARKWRPQNFKEMVGQEHVLKALIHALEHQRLHHAYLFTGTRGVGKTTIGRILAKCLNCEQGITAEPCGHCHACKEIAEGRFVDLIEIDAASRTKVEDMRELLDNVQYAPSQGRFKVYLIDEVHMLSQSSFNALLKTLEEPPEHVKFLLATTDPQKLPATILSRCLQFNLKNMPADHIVKHLTYILGEESVSFTEPALWLLARAANGSMRDALSLMDQAIGYGNNELKEDEVSAMLGTVDQHQVFKLIQAVADHDARSVLGHVAGLAEFSPDYSSVLATLISVLHRMTIEQVIPGATDNALGDQEQLVALSRALTAEDVQLFYQIALVGRKDLEITPDPRIGLEMTLLRMITFTPDPGQFIAGMSQSDPEKVSSSISVDMPAPDPVPDIKNLNKPAIKPEGPVENTEGMTEVPWVKAVHQLKITGLIHNIACHSVLTLSSQNITLEFEEDFYNLLKDTTDNEVRLKAALTEKYGEKPVYFKSGISKGETPDQYARHVSAEKQKIAEKVIRNDVEFNELLNHFNGRLVEGSIRPREY